MKIIKSFFAYDEREKSDNNKYYAHAFWIIMGFLSVVILVKQIFLRMPLSEYAIELIAFALGAIYILIRCIIAGQVVSQIQSKILFILSPIISAIWTIFIYIKSYEIMQMNSTGRNIFILTKYFLIILVLIVSFPLIMMLLAKRRAKKISAKLEEE